jgi:CubicO group peptidase (beta-lactamase class C family)
VLREITEVNRRDAMDEIVQDQIEIHGACREEFRAVWDVLERELRAGADIGASAAVFIDGEPVVDIWGGYVDEARTCPWQRDTIVNTFSTTKTMTALCALVLADQGELDLDARVTKYWPEFAAAGKGGGRGLPLARADLGPSRLDRAGDRRGHPRPRESHRAAR